jgi:hypothetical protein
LAAAAVAAIISREAPPWLPWIRNVASTVTKQINHRRHHVLHSQSGASPLRNGLEVDVIVASRVTTKSTPARILSDAFVVDAQDIGSGIVAFGPSLQLHKFTLPPANKELG